MDSVFLLVVFCFISFSNRIYHGRYGFRERFDISTMVEVLGVAPPNCNVHIAIGVYLWVQM